MATVEKIIQIFGPVAVHYISVSKNALKLTYRKVAFQNFPREVPPDPLRSRAPLAPSIWG